MSNGNQFGRANKLRRDCDDGDLEAKNFIEVKSRTAKRQPTSSRASASSTTAESVILDTTDDESVHLISPYRHLMAGNCGGIDFLFSDRFSNAMQATAKSATRDYGITKEAAFEELRRFLAIKIFTKDEFATKISPTPLMDKLWHDAILDTEFYAELQEALGLRLHHKPSAVNDGGPKHVRLATMAALYGVFFEDKYPISSPGPLQPLEPHQNSKDPILIYVQTLTGKIFSVAIGGKATIYYLKQMIQTTEGIPMDAQRIMTRGKELEGSKTLKDYGIVDGTILQLVLRLIGC